MIALQPTSRTENQGRGDLVVYDAFSNTSKNQVDSNQENVDTRHLQRRSRQSQMKPKVEVEEMASYEDLQARVSLLEKQNEKLTQLLAKTRKGPPSLLPKVNQPEAKRNVKSASGPRKHVMLQLAYCGEDAQDPNSREKIYHCVEDALLCALFQTSHIEAPCATSCQLKIIHGLEDLTDDNYDGWDEGGGPYCLQFSVIIRKLTSFNAAGIKQEPRDELEEDNEDSSLENNFTDIVNKALPSEVQLLAWAPFGYHSSVQPFTYQYFFPRANLDIQSMHEAALGITGTHQSSRKFGYMLNSLAVTPACCPLVAIDRTRPKCSLDTDEGETTDSDKAESEREMELDEKTGRVRVKKRKKMKLDIKSKQILQPCNHVLRGDGYEICVATMIGSLKREDALRIMWGLFCVGEGKCRPRDLEELLTGTSEDCIPVSRASDEALIVTKPDTSSHDIPYWSWDHNALRTTIMQLQHSWTHHAVKAEALRHSLWAFENTLLETSFQDVKGKEEMEKDEESELPRAQCDRLIGIRENVEQGSPFFSYTATCLMIDYIRPRLSRLTHPSTHLDALSEVQSQLAKNGWNFSFQHVQKRWNELLDQYRREKRRREENMEGEEGEEEEENGDWQYFEDMDKLLSSGVLSQNLPSTDLSTVKSPQKSDVAHTSGTGSSVAVPITIKAHMQADPKLPVTRQLHSSSVSSLVIHCKSSTALPVIIKSQMSSKTHYGVKLEASDSMFQLNSLTKSQATFQPVCTVKAKMASQTSGSSKKQLGSQTLSSVKTHMITQKDISGKTQMLAQPTVAIKTHITSQPTIGIQAKRVDVPQSTEQVSGKRPSSFVSPVAIKTRVVTQPKQPFDKKTPVSLPRIKTESPLQPGVSVSSKAEVPITPSIKIKTEPKSHFEPITICTQTHNRHEPLTPKIDKSNLFAIPEAVMSSVSQQKPNTTVLHHLGDSLFATQTEDSRMNLPSKSDMSEIFLEYHIQQGDRRLDQIEEEIIRMATRQKKQVIDRQQMERVDALSVKALRDIEYTSASLKNSLLGV